MSLRLHSVREFAELAFSHVGLDYRNYLISDERFFRPAEVHQLRGDYSKAKKILGWEPTVSFKELIQMMVDTDLKYLSRQDRNISWINQKTKETREPKSTRIMASEDVSPEAPRPLNCDKAHVELNWYSVLSIDECLRITSEQYKMFCEGPAHEAYKFCTKQIMEYLERAKERKLNGHD